MIPRPPGIRADTWATAQSLLYAIDHPPRPIIPAEVEDAVWDLGYSTTDTQTLLNQMKRERMKRAIAEAESSARGEPQPDVALLATILARPEQAVRHRIDGLLAVGGRVLLTAKRKTGKTTLVGNLTRSLITGEPFLGRFAVEPLEGLVAILNYEVSGEMFAGWLDVIGVPTDRTVVFTLRGRKNPLLTESGRDWLVDQLNEHYVSALIVDPFGRAFAQPGVTENDNSAVAAWFADLDRIAEAAMVSEVFVTNHAGHALDRSRGASAMEDWPDQLWLMTGEQDQPRELTMWGRADPGTITDTLVFDPITHALTMAGTGGRQRVSDQEKVGALALLIIQAVKEHPGLNAGGLQSAVRNLGGSWSNKTGNWPEAKAVALRGGMVREVPVPGSRAVEYWPPHLGPSNG